MKKLMNFGNFLILILLSFTSCSQDNSVAMKMSLDGEWEIIYDDTNEGKQAEWYTDKVFQENEGKQKIQVPSCWEEYKKDYEGVAFYRKKFNIPQTWDGKIVQLNFEAVNYLSEIWINDQVVGFHEGGYTPFSFRVDKLIKAGQENVLTMRVISPIILTDKRIDGLGRQEVPMWRGAITGGIWQSVSIEAKGQSRIADVFIEPKIDSNTAVFNLEVENAKTAIEKAELTVKVLSPEGKEVVAKTEQVEVLPGKNKLTWDLKIKDAQYWSMDNPYLYKAMVQVKVGEEITDTWEHKFGMREFTIKDRKFILNGKTVYLKGAFFEGLYPVKLAYPDSREMAIKEITLAKEAGFNMIRPWRKPAPKMWLDLCDSIGMLTVGSLVVECMHRPISTPRLPFVMENELRKTISANRNRTCIIQWELFNEINRPILSQMLNSMSLLARELDPTRMILDESGGWGEGANVYLPYDRIPHKFNDIHHYSGSQITEEEFNAYLSIAKTKEEIKAMGYSKLKAPGKNVVNGMISYVSELGYGSTPDLTDNNKRFAEDGNPLVAPTVYHKELHEGYKNALKKAGLEGIYPDLQKFYLEQQKMHGIANKRMLEATRMSDNTIGYCVHALVGGDWVLGAGLLDLWRNPKTLVYDLTKAANQEQIFPIRILPRNVYAEKGAKLQVFGVSELADEKVKLEISIQSEKGETVFEKTLEKDLANGISNMFETDLATAKMIGNYTVTVKALDAQGEVIITNTQPFDVFPAEQLVVPSAKIAVAATSKKLKDFLTKKNIEFVPFSPDLDKNIPVFVGQAKKGNPAYMKEATKIQDFVKAGGYAVFLEVPGKNVPGFERKLQEVAADSLPFGAQLHGKWATLGGWAAKSHIVTKHPVFAGLPTEMIMHGVYENVHPLNSMSKQEGKYIAGFIGYDHFPNNEIMVRHFNGPGEVWWSGDVVEAPVGQGTMLLSTLQLLKYLEKDPVADKILYNIIDFTANKNVQR